MNLRIEKIHPSNDEACVFIATEYLKMFLELNPGAEEFYNNGKIGERLTKNFINDYITEDIASDTIIYIAFIDDEMVGALQFDRDNHLSCLFVKEEYRNRFIGSQLLERLINDFDGFGIIKVDARIEACSLYERFSFKRIPNCGTKHFVPMELEMKKSGKI